MKSNFFHYHSSCRTSQAELINIPGNNILSLVFGGDDYNTLFVTTASKTFNVTAGGITDRQFSPESGLIFKVTDLNATDYPGRKLLL